MTRLLPLLLLLLAAPASSAEPRSKQAIAAFRKVNVCPSTGKFAGACPGYVIDHPYSRCLGGPDIPENMRWQTVIEAQIKDVFERDMCAWKRKLEAAATAAKP